MQPGLGIRGGGGSETQEASSPDKSPPTTKQCGQDLVFDLQGHPDQGLILAQPSVVRTLHLESGFGTVGNREKEIREASSTLADGDKTKGEAA